GMPYAQWVVADPMPDPIVYTDTAGSVAVITVVALVVVVVATLLLAGWAWWRRDRAEMVARRYIDAGNDIDPADPVIAHVLRQVGLARAVASLTDRVAVVLGIGIVA